MMGNPRQRAPHQPKKLHLTISQRKQDLSGFKGESIILQMVCLDEPNWLHSIQSWLLCWLAERILNRHRPLWEKIICFSTRRSWTVTLFGIIWELIIFLRQRWRQLRQISRRQGSTWQKKESSFIQCVFPTKRLFMQKICRIRLQESMRYRGANNLHSI